MTVFASGTATETTAEERFERLLALPPSAKLVFKVLETSDALTQREISDEAMLPRRTVRDALGRLKEEKLVEERIYIPDARKRLYASNPVDSG